MKENCLGTLGQAMFQIGKRITEGKCFKMLKIAKHTSGHMTYDVIIKNNDVKLPAGPLVTHLPNFSTLGGREVPKSEK